MHLKFLFSLLLATVFINTVSFGQKNTASSSNKPVIAYLSGFRGMDSITKQQLATCKILGEITAVKKDIEIVSFHWIEFGTCIGVGNYSSKVIGNTFSKQDIEVINKLHPGTWVLFDEIKARTAAGILIDIPVFQINIAK